MFEFVGINKSNPRHKQSYVVCNTIISHYQENFVIDADNCPQLREDCMQVEVSSQGGLDKSYEKNDANGLKGHLLDCLRALLANAEKDVYDYLSSASNPI